MKKIVIFGGGPCGMRLAENLIDSGKDVHLYERSESLGGCWKVKWENGYFKEHSPRVMTTSYKKIIELTESLEMENPFNPIYGTSINSTAMFIKYFLKNLSILDNIKFMYSLMFINDKDERNVKEWIDENNISTSGRKALRILAITLANIPENLSAYCFFNFIYEGLGTGKFLQFREGDLWLKKWEKRLIKKGVKIHLETKLNSFHENNGIVDYALTSKGRVFAEEFLLSIPLWSLKEVIKNCKSEKLKNNWMKPNDFDSFCEKSSYSGLGIQLHFEKKTDIELNENWCQTCTGDWTIIVLKTSNYNEKFTKNKKIKEVWSCVIVDFTRKSKRLEKTPGKLTIDEIGDEVIYQLQISLGRKIKPSKITYNVKDKKKGKWNLIESAYSCNTMGSLKPRGKKIKNLFSIGCHNLWEIAILEGALNSADNFTNTS